jgi:rod shape-determining protein MreD
MNPSARRTLGLCLALFVAALAQMVYAEGMRLGGARPDFLILTIVLGAMFCDANHAAGLGFWGGLLTASINAPPHAGFGSLIVSRTLVAFGVGWLEGRIFRDNPLLAIPLVAVGTALAEGLFFLFDPQRAIHHWARALLLTTLYNTLLALPLYFIIRRITGIRREIQAG